jgi:hypothetical protein
VKTALMSFISNPWLMWGSCYGHSSSPVFGNGDGADNWATLGVPDYSKLIWGTGNHSWVVLRQPGMGGNASICIDLNSATNAYASIIFSPRNGFGTANGGANGSASARPTASDELVLIAGTAWGGADSTLWRAHLMMTSSGSSTRVLLQRAGYAVGLWMFETVRNPISAWTYPVVGAVIGNNVSNAGAVTYANLAAAANTKGRIGDACSFYLTYEGYGSSSIIPSTRTSPDDDTGEWAVFPAGLISTHTKHKGRKGELVDCWWGSGQLTTGDTYPDDASRSLLHHGNMVFPWNGSVPCSWM